MNDSLAMLCCITINEFHNKLINLLLNVNKRCVRFTGVTFAVLAIERPRVSRDLRAIYTWSVAGM